MSTALTLANLAIVAVLLARDWGHRRVTLFALLRPLVLSAVVIPFVMPGWDLTGNGLLLELATVVAGAALGVFACLFMRVSVDANGQSWTDAGWAYALVWLAIAAARQAFIYGCQHWFTRDLGMFLVDNRISVNAFADAIMLLTLTTVVANRAAILIRGRLAANPRSVAVAAG
ncbi:hypothetical protein [Rugosimonospora africana]|uniref:Uncharacterized protein n=1 Tax=Rugosimonospora africana TaxID=556532 RepID=A0A8J3VT62_9ACTN|nr:hypothetical protein [Rugosimonospora africana]GIH18087.1 hypothetical protein Raf01_62590 [Rugosimonospora africana]